MLPALEGQKPLGAFGLSMSKNSSIELIPMCISCRQNLS